MVRVCCAISAIGYRLMSSLITGIGLRRKIRVIPFSAILVSMIFLPIACLSATSEQPLNLSTPQQIENAFLQGLQLLEAGQPRKAVFLFRQILARDPNLPRVRLELARAYFMMQSWSESRAEFVSVLSGDIPLAAKKNILRFINAIDARRGFDWSAAIGISLSPEAGRDYKTDTVFLDFFGTKLPFKVEREENDVIGLTLDGSAEVRRKFLDSSEGPSVVGFVSASADVFEAEGSDHDDYIFGASTGPRFIWPQTTAFAAANGSVRYRSGDVYEDRMGISSAIEYRSETGFAPFLSVAYTDVNVHETEAQDGGLYSLRTGFSKSVSGNANVGVSVTFQHFDAQESYETYDAVGLSLLGRADLGAGFGATARASLRYTSYKSKTPLFFDRREEKQFGVDVEIVKNDVFLLDQFSPFVQLGYTYNDSSINIFTYNEYRFVIGVKNAF